MLLVLVSAWGAGTLLVHSQPTSLVDPRHVSGVRPIERTIARARADAGIRNSTKGYSTPDIRTKTSRGSSARSLRSLLTASPPPGCKAHVTKVVDVGGPKGWIPKLLPITWVQPTFYVGDGLRCVRGAPKLLWKQY